MICKQMANTHPTDEEGLDHIVIVAKQWNPQELGANNNTEENSGIPFFDLPWILPEDYNLFASCLKEVCINSVSVPFNGHHRASAMLVQFAEEKYEDLAYLLYLVGCWDRADDIPSFQAINRIVELGPLEDIAKEAFGTKTGDALEMTFNALLSEQAYKCALREQQEGGFFDVWVMALAMRRYDTFVRILEEEGIHVGREEVPYESCLSSNSDLGDFDKVARHEGM